MDVNTEKNQSEEALDLLVERVRDAQQKYALFSQEKVDIIFRAAALAATSARLPLAKAAAEETGMGVTEDKVIKNHFAAEFIYNKFKNDKTCGVIERDEQFGISKIAEPVGLLAGVIPTTNPTSTTIFKSLLALKTRNGIIFSPHPRAKRSTVMAARVIHDAAVEAGAPAGIIGWIAEPTVELSKMLMAHPHINLILATGGPGMVHAAYSSGKPAIGVGAGNTPAIIDETADIRIAVNSILLSKTFDNGIICASEQSVIVVDAVYDAVKAEFLKRGAYICTPEEKERLGRVIILENGKLNSEIVGQPAGKIAETAGFFVPEETKVLIGEAETVSADEPMSYEKLSPVLGMYREKDFESAVARAEELIAFGGMGHTSVLYTNPTNKDRILTFGETASTGRVLINQPSSQGAIGDIYNFRLEPSLTLGCGSWGGNSVSENVGVKHLMNIKIISERRENMLGFRVPQKVYFKSGCLPLALEELAGAKRAMIITDKPVFDLGLVDMVTRELEKLGVEVAVFSEVKPDPDLLTIRRGNRLAAEFTPDLLMAVGGGSPMDAAKLIWLLYEHPEIEFEDISLRFMDIRKRVFQFPQLGKKAKLICIPTTSGTGSEVTPFAVVTDNRTGQKYPITDYQLLPSMAIIDPDLTRTMPKKLTAYSGIDAVVHALESIVAVTASDFTIAYSLESARVLFKYLRAAYRDGLTDLQAREKVHNAATMAGMAFANSFLGVCHSMAHKLGAAFDIPHGLANALLIHEVVRFNASEAPRKQAAYPQYGFPEARARYARMARYLGFGGCEDSDDVLFDRFTSELRKLCDDLELPRTIREIGIPESEFTARLDELAEDAFDDQCTAANPRYPLISEIRRMFQNAYYG